MIKADWVTLGLSAFLILLGTGFLFLIKWLGFLSLVTALLLYAFSAVLVVRVILDVKHKHKNAHDLDIDWL